jgi:hypothetical protein
MQGFSTRSSCVAVVVLLALNPPNLSPQKPRETPREVWSWFEDCSNKKYMRLEVLMRGTVIHRSAFPICPVNDVSGEVGRHQKILTFSFKGGYVFQGKYHTARTQTIEADVWQAGKDPGLILFGVSFASRNQVLLNTIHFAKIGTESTTEIDRDLIVRTFPIRPK